MKALKAGKHVHVEKPLCLNTEQLGEIEAVYQSAAGSPALMVGFNRRFAPLARLMKDRLPAGPLAMLYRISAGPIPAESWIQNVEIGGGRLVGEACHFVDFLAFLCGSLPVRVCAQAVPDPATLHDTAQLAVEFENGSIGTVCYQASGSKDVEKEYVEASGGGATAILHDFKSLVVHGGGKPFKTRLASQDKGQHVMVREFLDAIREGKPCPVPVADIVAVTKTMFGALDSIRTRQVTSL